MGNLEQKNEIAKINYSLDGLNNRLEMGEKRNSKHESRRKEITHSK